MEDNLFFQVFQRKTLNKKKGGFKSPVVSKPIQNVIKSNISMFSVNVSYSGNSQAVKMLQSVGKKLAEILKY